MRSPALDQEGETETTADGTTRSRNRRVLMLSTALGVGGGAEEQVMLLSLGLRARGWQVKIVSLLPLHPVSAELEASDIPVCSLGMKRGVPDPRALPGLMRELRSFQPDIVHCHMPQANILARVVRPLCPFPVLVSTLHNLTMERVNGSSGRFLEMAHRWTDRYSDITTVICTPAVQSYVQNRAVPADKIAVLYNGVDTSKYQADSEVRRRLRNDLALGNKFTWLAIGRFERAKAWPNLIRAFAAVVKNTETEMSLLICGRGSLEQEIRAEVHKCGVDGQVQFLGVRRDIADVMNAADAFVMSSYLEGLPMVLLQASAVGMPIVATSVGGNAEIVLNGVNGFTVQPHSEDALTGGMESVMRLPEAERARMAERGRQLVREKFDLQAILDRWEALYLEQIKKNFSPQLPH